MILNKDETKVIASCGWVEKSSLLVIDVKTHETEKLKFGDGEYLRLRRISGDYFLASEHFSGTKLILSIHSFQNPCDKLAECIASAKDLTFKGNVELWKLAPKYYVEYLKDEFQPADYRLIEINPNKKEGLFPNLEWFDDSYDHGYQGVMDVKEIPDTNLLIFSIQRSSQPVLYDIANKKVVKKVKLAGRAGNPIFTFRDKQREIWCADYDVLVKMRTLDFKILAKRKLQGPSLQCTMQWIGDFAFTPNEQYCVVARPFSTDAVLLDCASLKNVASCKSQLQPLGVVVLSNLDFVTRDWKTGKLEFGSFKIKRRFWCF